jgi:uncharacterized RDD family membrane protein YckC
MADSKQFTYSSFRRRFFALWIDCLILYVGTFVTSWIVAMFLGAFIAGVGHLDLGETMAAVYIVLFFPASIIANWLYFALLESSERKATLGKMIFQIEVVDDDFQQLTFGEATARYFSKILSSLSVIGYLMPIWSDRKKALHDMLCKTVVVRKRF